MTPPLLALLAIPVLSACGNKGDLYLVPDAINQLEFEQLQQSLQQEEVPLADPVEVDDQSIYIDPARRTGSQRDESSQQ